MYISEFALPEMIGKQVHVKDWAPGAVFEYQGTDENGVHHLITPKTREVYKTKNHLRFTRKHAEERKKPHRLIGHEAELIRMLMFVSNLPLDKLVEMLPFTVAAEDIKKLQKGKIDAV